MNYYVIINSKQEMMPSQKVRTNNSAHLKKGKKARKQEKGVKYHILTLRERGQVSYPHLKKERSSKARRNDVCSGAFNHSRNVCTTPRTSEGS